MKKLTKIVATIGPVTDSEEMIEKLILAGVNIFRFNFKHNTVEWHGERIERVNKVAKKMGVPVGTLIDLQGPEIRINMPTPEMEVKTGEMLIFGEKAFEQKEKGFSISHPDIIKYLEQGQKLLADDGSFTFFVEKKGEDTYLRSDTDGVLKHRKSLNIPGSDFPFPVLIERDFDGLKLAVQYNMSFVALSFVRSPSDLKVVRAEAKKLGVTSKIVAKIETQKALDCLDEIIEETDALMVARGDLGVELPIEQVPYYQKLMISKCIKEGKPVITATQMLQTMIDNPYPTRAEISDMANAVYDQTDCVMLSGETASGKYPLKTVEMMNKTVSFYDTKTLDDIRKRYQFAIHSPSAMVCDTAYELYLQHRKADKKVAGFLVFTQTGETARLISRYRPKVPVFAFTPFQHVCESMTINFGVMPSTFKVTPAKEVNHEEIDKAYNILLENGHIKEGEQIIVIHGNAWGEGAGATTIKII